MFRSSLSNVERFADQLQDNHDQGIFREEVSIPWAIVEFIPSLAFHSQPNSYTFFFLFSLFFPLFFFHVLCLYATL